MFCVFSQVEGSLVGLFLIEPRRSLSIRVHRCIQKKFVSTEKEKDCLFLCECMFVFVCVFVCVCVGKRDRERGRERERERCSLNLERRLKIQCSFFPL